MAGGTQKTTTTSNNEPWEPAQPFLEQGLQDAGTLYSSGNLFQPNTTSTVVPMANQTTQSLSGMEGLANANMGPNGLGGQAQSIINAGGLNPFQQQSMDYLSNVGSNPFDLSQNQAYQTYRNQLQGDVGNSVNAMAAASGRYGSGAHTANLGNTMTDALARADLGQMGRMDQLNSERFNAGQTAMGNLGSAYGLAQMPMQSLAGVGAAYEDLYGRQLNDQLRITQAQLDQPRQGIEWMNAIASGAGSLGGNSQQVAQMPGQNPLLTGLGYARGGLGMLGSFGGGQGGGFF